MGQSPQCLAGHGGALIEPSDVQLFPNLNLVIKSFCVLTLVTNQLNFDIVDTRWKLLKVGAIF